MHIYIHMIVLSMPCLKVTLTINASSITNLSWTTFARLARQFVLQPPALEEKTIDGAYSIRLIVNFLGEGRTLFCHHSMLQLKIGFSLIYLKEN